jgi:hypothetical protein
VENRTRVRTDCGLVELKGDCIGRIVDVYWRKETVYRTDC